MESKELNTLKPLKYANLNKEQEEKLRNYENEFNAQYKKEFYFMVMDKENMV